jgi:hypothetical protein
MLTFRLINDISMQCCILTFIGCDSTAVNLNFVFTHPKNILLCFFWDSVHPRFLNMASLKKHHSLIKEWTGEGQLVNECLLKSLPVEREWPVVIRLLLSSKRMPGFKTSKSLGKNKNMDMGSDGTWNQHWMCWWGPAAVYLTDQLTGQFW